VKINKLNDNIADLDKKGKVKETFAQIQK